MKKRIAVLLLFAFISIASCSLCETLAEEHIFFGPFEVENIRGDEVITEEIFAQAEITIVNFWATWCPPCVDELPALAKLSTVTEGKVQVLGVLIDGLLEEGEQARDDSALKAMNTLLDACNASFPIVLAEDSFLAALSSIIEYVPTSFLVSKDGELLDYIVGGHSESEWIEITAALIAE